MKKKNKKYKKVTSGTYTSILDMTATEFWQQWAVSLDVDIHERWHTKGNDIHQFFSKSPFP